MAYFPEVGYITGPDKKIEQAKSAVLKEPFPTTMKSLVTSLRESGFPEPDVRAAVWSLIGKKITLTQELSLVKR